MNIAVLQAKPEVAGWCVKPITSQLACSLPAIEQPLIKRGMGIENSAKSSWRLLMQSMQMM